MAGQNLPIEEPSQHLSLEAAQNIVSHDVKSDKRQLALGLSGLVLMAVALWCIHPHTNIASQPSRSVQDLAFTPGFNPALKTRGFLTAPATQRLPAPVAMLPGQSRQTLVPPARGGYRQAMASLHMNAAKGDTATKDEASSMESLALAALDSGGDPAQLASVFALMPAKDQKKVKMLQADVLSKAKSMPGVTAPLGFFDPVGFCSEVSEGKLCFYREVELKHGRVAMLAALGFLVGENFHPLFGGDIDAPAYLAFQQTPLQTFWPAVVAAIAIPEIFSVFSFKTPALFARKGEEGGMPWEIRSDFKSADLGFDPLGLKPTDPAELKEMQTKELQNGRLGMIAAAGMIAQELASHEKPSCSRSVDR